MLVFDDFDDPRVWHNTKTFQQDAQKDQTSYPPNPGGYFTLPPRGCQDSLFAQGRALSQEGCSELSLYKGWLG